MATKTIPEQTESSTIDTNTLLLIDSGVQTFKVTAPNIANGLQKFILNPASVSTQAELITALASCVTNGGGMIQILKSFSVSSIHTVPENTKIMGLLGAAVVTVGAGGGFILSNGTQLQDIHFSTTLNDASSVISITGNYAVVRGCKIAAVAANAVTCIRVTGNANKIHNSLISGVVGQAATIGIDYASGSDNGDQDCVFLS